MKFWVWHRNHYPMELRSGINKKGILMEDQASAMIAGIPGEKIFQGPYDSLIRGRLRKVKNTIRVARSRKSLCKRLSKQDSKAGSKCLLPSGERQDNCERGGIARYRCLGGNPRGGNPERALGLAGN